MTAAEGPGESELAPRATPATARIGLLDLLRGLAVFGILLANIPLMGLSSVLDWGGEPADLDHPLDLGVFLLVRLVADTKFITIFSLLFGAGLALMQRRRAGDEAGFGRIWMRRMAVLAVFGAGHAILLWWGDILFHYALVGVAAFFLRALAPRLQVVLGGALLLVGFFLSLGSAYVLASLDDIDELVAEAHRLYGSGDPVAMTVHRAEMFVPDVVFVAVVWGPRTLGLFLIGMAAVRAGWLERLRRPERRVAVVAATLAAASLPFHALWLWGELGDAGEVAGPAARGGASYWAGLLLAPAYVVGVARWDLAGALRGLRAGLAAVGRMALTSYLTHSAVTALLFNYLGLYDRVSRAGLFAIALAIFAVQLAVSPWWLARFGQGPVEAVWRRLTYGPRC